MLPPEDGAGSGGAELKLMPPNMLPLDGGAGSGGSGAPLVAEVTAMPLNMLEGGGSLAVVGSAAPQLIPDGGDANMPDGGDANGSAPPSSIAIVPNIPGI
jgi:hypothetical protein